MASATYRIAGDANGGMLMCGFDGEGGDMFGVYGIYMLGGHCPDIAAAFASGF
ncbi:hypothetical protein ABZ714_29450 [Streptomyces sp. NPDC006798]|uniref:hypothetical protein n=1 Tax=Streptomyces sp. NPDC006798 TaxID=3155462 RepID=UPI0034094BE2